MEIIWFIKTKVILVVNRWILTMEYKKEVRNYFDTLLNFIYPRNIYCILCGVPIEREEKFSLCSPCKSEVMFLRGRVCDKCGKPLDELYIPNRCPQCTNREFYFTKAFSCVEYDENTKKIVYGLKYNGLRYFSYHISEIMGEHLTLLVNTNFDLIIPVPLHKNKERKRSFNQSFLIAKYLGRILDKPIDRKSLVRIKDTLEQNKLSKEERIENLRKAFEISENHNIIDKNILLVDDVFTTGETANQCSKTLIENGAKEIHVITFATGRNI